MNEIYEVWNPIIDSQLPMKLSFKSMDFSPEQLKVNLLATSQKSISLVFSPAPLVVKICNESFRLITLVHLPKPKQGSIFLVTNSHLLEDFHRDSLNIYVNDPIFHLAIVTDEWVDVITSSFPKIQN